MADQGRNADGLGDTAETVNVVRFPGDWFGPVEDLVPIASDGDWEREDLGTEEQPPDEAGHLYANAFWGEDAETVHRVSASPLGDATVSVRARTPFRRRVVVPLGAILVVLAVAFGLLITSGPGQASRPRTYGALAHPNSAPTITRVVTVAVHDVSKRSRPPGEHGRPAALRVSATDRTVPAPTSTYVQVPATTRTPAGHQVSSSTTISRPMTGGSTSKPAVRSTTQPSGGSLPDLQQIQQQP